MCPMFDDVHALSHYTYTWPTVFRIGTLSLIVFLS